MDKNNIEQLKKLAKVFNTDNVITSAEIEQVLSGIVSLLSSFKKSNEALNDETKGYVVSLIESITDEHSKLVSEIKTDKAELEQSVEDRLSSSIAEMRKMCEDILLAKPEDGKDADEDRIIDAVMEKIQAQESAKKEEPSDPYEDALETRDELESLDGDDRLDAKAIKNLDKYIKESDVIFTGHNGVEKIMPGTGISVDNTNPRYPIVTATGGSGGGHTIQDEGVSLTQRAKLNFKGALVTVTDNSVDGSTDVTIAGDGAGDVVGPSSSTANDIAVFDGATGKIIKDSGTKVADLATVAALEELDTEKAPLRPTTEKTTLVDADEVTGNDSAATFGQIRTTWTNVKAFLKSYFDTLYASLAGATFTGNITVPNVIEGYRTQATAAGTTTLTAASTGIQVFTGTTTQTVVLPVATTLTNGHSYTIKNKSTGLVTVNTSGSNALVVIAPKCYAVITCIDTAGGTGTASWEYYFANDTPRVGSTTSSATPTINTDHYNVYKLTAQTVDITSFTTNLSGTPTDNQKLWISITGTAARAITWGTSFEASTVALPTTTATTARLDVGFVWNAATSKWRCVAVA